MIDIRRDGTKTCVTIDGAGVIVGATFTLSWDAGSEWAAKLLTEALRTAMYDRLEAIRKHAYAEGWKHAKAKRTKSTWFSRGWKAET